MSRAALPPAAQARNVDHVCDRFEACWQAAIEPRPRIEDYIAEATTADRDWLLRELLALELEYRRRDAEEPTVEEYRCRFEQHAELVEEVFAAERAAPSVAGLTLGNVFGDYELLDKLGQGGMGVVYKARQRSANRIVALKVIRRDRLDGLSADRRAEWLKRFQTEAQAAARIEHENVVPVYEVGAVGGQPFYSMRYCDGRSLADVAALQPLSGRQAATYLEQVARAIHQAHTHGILHRDLKPRNVLMDDADRPFVTDFGLAKWMEGGPASGGQTQTGDWLGTPWYTAPEQARDASRAVAASDIYSLGATLYDLLTGRPPFRAAPGPEALHQLLHEEPIPPRRLNPAVDRDLETITLKCLHKQPARRYPTAADLAADLRRYLHGQPILARPVGRAERLGRWCRRNTAAAGLLAALLFVLSAATLVTTVLAVRTDEAWRAEAGQRRRAEEARGDAETALYFHRITLAELHWRGNDIRQADQVLDECLPGDGEPDQRAWEWYYLKRLCHADLGTLHGHTQWVYAVAFSSDGRQVVSAAGTAPDQPFTPGEVTVWDAATGRVVRQLTSVPHAVHAAALSPDGRLLACAGRPRDEAAAPGEVTLWDLGTGNLRHRLAAHTRYNWSVAFSPDSKLLAAGSSAFQSLGGELQPGGVRVWSAATGQELCSFAPPQRGVTAVAFSTVGRRIASAREDGVVEIREFPSGRVLGTLDGHGGLIPALAFSRDGDYLATANTDGMIRLWSVAGRQVQVLRGHDGGVRSVAFRHDGRRLVSAGDDSTVRVWDVAAGTELITHRGHAWSVRSAAFSPDGRRLVSGSQDQTVKLWDAERHPQARVLHGHSFFVSALTFLPSQAELISACPGGQMCRWDARTGALLAERTFGMIHKHRWPRTDTAFSPGGDRVAGVSKEDLRIVKVWETADGRERFSLSGHSQPVAAVAFSADGQRLATASAAGDAGAGPGEMILWDATDGRRLLTVPGEPRGLVSLAFSPDGRLLAGAGRDCAVPIWDATTGAERITLRGHADTVAAVAFSPDGGLVATSGYLDGTVRLWDGATGAVRHVLSAPSPVLGVVFSPDGRRVAAASPDLVRLWDVATGRAALTLRPPTGRRPADWAFNACVAFSPDGAWLAANSWDRDVLLWDATPRD